MKLVIASNNPDKVAEIKDLLEEKLDQGIEVLPRPAELSETVEDGDTLEYNAIKKATEVAQFTGLPAVADDTGLFVDALDGAPGVYSARYAGENVTYQDNVNKLLAELEGVAHEKRTARFRTIVAYVEPGEEPATFEGVVEGHIATAECGDNGFGYDPVFVPVETDGKSFAEISSDEKKAISHRARALDTFLRLGLVSGHR